MTAIRVVPTRLAGAGAVVIGGAPAGLRDELTGGRMGRKNEMRPRSS
ncbi:hypothetical protein [Streptomyces sp. NPDC002426]